MHGKIDKNRVENIFSVLYCMFRPYPRKGKELQLKAPKMELYSPNVDFIGFSNSKKMQTKAQQMKFGMVSLYGEFFRSFTESSTYTT